MSSWILVHTEVVGHHTAQIEGVVGRVPLRHEQHHDAFLADGFDGQAGGDAGVDAAGKGNDEAAAFELF